MESGVSNITALRGLSLSFRFAELFETLILATDLLVFCKATGLSRGVFERRFEVLGLSNERVHLSNGVRFKARSSFDNLDLRVGSGDGAGISVKGESPWNSVLGLCSSEEEISLH